jgi:hypothetical protein
MGLTRNTSKILMGKYLETKLLGRPRRIWEDNIKEIGCEDGYKWPEQKADNIRGA